MCVLIQVGSPRSFGGPENNASPAAYTMMYGNSNLNGNNGGNLQLASPVNSAQDFYGRTTTGKADDLATKTSESPDHPSLSHSLSRSLTPHWLLLAILSVREYIEARVRVT